MDRDPLLEQLRARRPAALPALATAYGRELVGIAYLIVQEHEAAEDAAARACADIWTQVDAAPPPDRVALRRTLLAHLVDHALTLRKVSRSVDPRLAGAAEARFRALSPTLRAVLALTLVAHLPLDDVASILGTERRTIDRRLAPLVAREGWDGLRAGIEPSLAELPVRLDADAIRQALDTPPAEAGGRWRVPTAIAGTVAVAFMAWAVAAGPATPPGPLPVTPATASPPLVSRPVPLAARPESVAPFTLSTCQIGPADTGVLFAGWLTKGELDIGQPDEQDAPAYALVTSGQAMRLGTRRPGGSLVPRAAGRQACIFDPATGHHLAVGLAPDWSPPRTADGCPPSPTGEFGGYREFGGPGAFVLPSVGSSDRVAGQAGIRLLVRLAPPAGSVGELGATLSALDGDAVLAATVDGVAETDSASSLSGYVWVSGLEVPTGGCWVLNLTIDGQVIGVAAVPFSPAE
jgi:DNA-directed RNA polymerase specialized sigma24 family protein